MRCCRQADGPRRTHLGAIVLTHGLVVPIVVVAVPGHRYKILVQCDEEVPLCSGAKGVRRAVHAKYVALAVQVRRRRRLVRTSRRTSDPLIQLLLPILNPPPFTTTLPSPQPFHFS